MKFYELDPEVAGEIGPASIANFDVHPPVVTRLEYVFHGWLGDDLIESFPCYIVTSQLRDRLQQEPLTGYQLKPVTVSTSEQFRELYPNRELPCFAWLVPTGVAGVDDFALSATHQLVVSENVMKILNQSSISQCDIDDFTKG